ncbi:ATP-dependent exoDNAse beta subunit RecB [Methanonatronarchaeum thermophilum]|uniref:DNA 3'-5' helicase n=1 Tax=Methanonatronarchaeum thermophilum TaxID=1927129 RepID=A0A1Y3GAI5_9EURY|nr:ATP-dependent helicase [Methanonatronarchaeum thermophilum]OUJ18429.1 ATP-dependent exoDNAse beta subunit RecB [Methanonatronarchaeum thermophilum]
MTTPNKEQKKLIENTEGIYLVDAGPGTGKTYTLTHRYINLLKQQVEPDEILLITFTRNAADQLKQKIYRQTDIKKKKVRDAPINTFHGQCKKILDRHGFNAPQHIGIKDHITNNTKTIESSVYEATHFHRYFNQFKQKHPEYKKYYAINQKETNILNLIKSLAVKGIIPQKNGWYRDSEKHLNGDIEQYLNKTKKLNQTDGKKQSTLRKRLSRYKHQCHPQNAPNPKQIRGPKGTKQIDPQILKTAFKEDRNELKKYIHDIYHEYLQYTLSKNYLNYSFHLLYTYILLIENHQLQQKIGYNYVMIDEFQDTNEIQLKLALLLSNNGNICVVGDWKQSIYSFQYADVQNILQFKKRLNKTKKTLNQNKKRIKYPTNQINKINLTENYRSGQKIIDFAETALTLKATRNEKIDKNKIKNKITKLNSNTDHKSTINAFHSHNEKQAILTKIQKITNNPNYTIKNKETERQLNYKDIAVLTRTRQFGLELQKQARQHNIPASFEGGVNLFTTNPAIILLAWLRILNHKHSKKGWAVILENTGYNLPETKHILKTRKYPENHIKFYKELKKIKTLPGTTKRIYDKYNIDNAFSTKTTEILNTIYSNSYLNHGEIIQFIEENIKEGETYEVDTTHRQNTITIQTIHGAKGLEYPVVFVSNINQHNFPSTNKNQSTIQYHNLTGIRQKKKYKKQKHPFIYDNWKTYLVNKSIDKGHNEERRLMYVAMTRAKKHLYLTAETKQKSQFYKNLNTNKKQTKPDIKPNPKPKTQKTQFKTQPTKQKTPIKLPITTIIEKTKSKGQGTKHGIELHKYAEKYIKNIKVKPKNQDQKNVKKYIDQLTGTKIPEQKCTHPINIKNQKIILKGKIDLIHKTNNKIEIIDYKTEKSKKTKKPYQTQLSLYYHTLKQIYPNKKITPKIYYTQTNQEHKIKPQTKTTLKNKITKTLKKQKTK